MVVGLTSLRKWEDAVNYYEENDASGEDVDLSSIIWFVFFNLGSHVRHGALIRLKIRDILTRGEAKVDQLHVPLSVYNNIFQFKVSVNYTGISVHIVESVEKLSEEKATNFLSHASIFLTNVVEEVPSDVLHYDVDLVLDDSARGLLDEPINAVFIEFDNILMLQLVQVFYFISNGHN